MFGKVKISPQNESTPFHPRSPYAISKVTGFDLTRNYREAYEIFAVSGILFNHESPRRGFEFVTRKISLSVAKIKNKLQNELVLGNLNSKRDWGYAEDYVEAMWKMMQIKKPKDYVIASGKNHSVKDFINECTKFLNLKTKWLGKGLDEKLINTKNNKVLIKIDKNFFRPSEVENLKGNYNKAKKDLNWKPKTNFQQLINIMMTSDLKYVEKHF